MPNHRPRADPCDCGVPARSHRPSHVPHGDPCESCGVPARNHRTKHHPPADGSPCPCGAQHGVRTRSAHERQVSRAKERVRQETRERKPQETFFVGLDGEGVGRDHHKYVMLNWSDIDSNKKDSIEASVGRPLSTVECLDFLLDMPRTARAFAYAFNYDLTKMLTDVDDEALYKLCRPELPERQRAPEKQKFGPRPVKWNGYLLNLIGTKFTVKKDKKTRVVWDVFKFFQSKFVTALVDWKVGEEDRLTRMSAMKDQRADFDKLYREDPERVRDYCYDECRDMAALADKLTTAHEEAGLPLKNYFGAGSSAGAMLKLMGIREQVREGPDALGIPIASAFFGGRFENSVVGEIEGPVWSYDISSAYPYHLYQMPCLGCGKWTKTRSRKRVKEAAAACVSYRLGKPPKGITWGPFPFRMKEGSIAFPATSGGGWVWKEEYLAGERNFPHVEFREAWVYETKCRHRPFDMIPGFYVERLKLGKEGPGIVIKLGMNSCYGKLAQSVGNAPPFRCWIWAGMITSNTRAQILDALGSHVDRNNMLAVATDGIYTRERLTLPAPIDTGTADKISWNDKKTERISKPLGGWEEKLVDKGVFFARPGIYFPLNPTEKEIKQVRARGVGRAVMYDNCAKVVQAWKEGANTVKLPNVTRFRGMKSSISRSTNPKTGKHVYRRVDLHDQDGRSLGRPAYGQWETRKIEMSFNPHPKRETRMPDGTLSIRHFAADAESMPYDRSIGQLSEEAILMKMGALEAEEQPQGDDLADYEYGE